MAAGRPFAADRPFGDVMPADPVALAPHAVACEARLGGLLKHYARRDLEDGSCRLPKLPPAAMKELLLVWLSPGGNGGVTCKACGLEYPHQNYRPLLAACPGCASREWDWAHLVRDYDRAWKGLDGYAGDPPDAGGASGGPGET
jgi:hypothetical protein